MYLASLKRFFFYYLGVTPITNLRRPLRRLRMYPFITLLRLFPRFFVPNVTPNRPKGNLTYRHVNKNYGPRRVLGPFYGLLRAIVVITRRPLGPSKI